MTLDTTRADRIGAYGNRDAATPRIDALAREGILFESAFAPTPITLPSHASILTGLYPSEHGVRDNGLFTLAPEATLISEVLSRRGWRTGAFLGSIVLGARSGLDQGFEVYRGPGVLRGGSAIAERPADEVVDDALAWFAELESGERFFAWLHFFDPHTPYAPPQPWARRNGDLYDGEIAFVDSQIARVLSALEERGRIDDLFVVVTADHGEALGEHGEPTHGILLYQATVRVPLILSGGFVAGGRGSRVAHPVSIADLAATLLEVTGIERAEMPEIHTPPMLSRDGSVRAQKSERAIYLETFMPYHMMGWRALQGLVLGEHKFIQGRAPEIYALPRDPGESRNLAVEDTALAEVYRARLSQLLRNHRSLDWAGDRRLDADERQLLELLGYVSALTEGDPFAPELLNPADRIGDIKKGLEAAEYFNRWMVIAAEKPAATAWEEAERKGEERALLEKAKEILVELKENNPRTSRLPVDLGAVEVALGNHAAAIPLLEQNVHDSPRSSEYRYNLGLAYGGVGRQEDALREVRKAVDLANPASPQYFQWLALHHSSVGEFGRAVWWLEELNRRFPMTGSKSVEVKNWLTLLRQDMLERGQRPNPPPDL
jgi:arylsulfatase A-like enzyme